MGDSEQENTTQNTPAAHCTTAPPDTSAAQDTLAQLEDSIAELSAHIQAATSRLLSLVRVFDQREGWVRGGFVSCAHWLAWRTGDDLGTAREKVRVARALESLPLISEAFSRAEVSYSKVRAMTRVATAENEAQLLVMGREATASQLEKIVRGVGRAQPQELEVAQAQHESRLLQYYYTDQGMLELKVRLTPEAGALVIKALEAATSALASQGKPTPALEDSFVQRQADALVLLAESALDHDLGRGSRADRYQVVVHVDAEALRLASPPSAQVATGKVSAEEPAEVATGKVSAEEPAQVATGKVSAEEPERPEPGRSATERPEPARSELEEGVGLCLETSRRIACCSSVVVMAEDQKGNPLAVGRKTRRPSTALARALKTRDRGCQFPGCSHSRYVEAHHLVHWADGGPTDLSNLVQLCSHHHRAVHELGFRVSRDEAGALIFFFPDGTPLRRSPASRIKTGEHLKHLTREHARAGLMITADTGGPLEYTGAPFDLHDAVSLLLPGQGRPTLDCEGRPRKLAVG